MAKLTLEEIRDKLRDCDGWELMEIASDLADAIDEIINEQARKTSRNIV